jgi:hypothetical protein
MFRRAARLTPQTAVCVSQDVPTTVTAGSSFEARLTMRNNGTTTWAAGYALGHESSTWGETRIAVSGSVAPGSTHTFARTLRAPSAPGSYTMEWRMLRGADQWFGYASEARMINVEPLVVTGNVAAFVSQEAPASVPAGASFDVAVTMRNSGTTTWALRDQQGHFLGSESPRDNVTWGGNRIFMEPGVSAAPGQSYTFRGTMRAPSAAGTYAMQWQMLQDAVEWFGAPSTLLNIIVVEPRNDATFVAQSVPQSVRAGGGFAVSVTMRNSGETVWALRDVQGHYLGSEAPMDNVLWGTNRVFMSPGVSVAPGESYTFTGAMRAPATPGDYTMRWRMLQDAVEWFGATSPLLTISVTDRGPLEARQGVVRFEGTSIRDDLGHFLGLGTTIFWAGWGYRHDRARLEQNLQFLSEYGFDYIRVLGNVGNDDPTNFWAERPMDPRWPDYDQVIAGLTDLAYDQYGIRIEWTLFGGIDFTPTPASREALVDRFIAMSRGREEKIMMFEVANEAWQNGFGGSEGIAELRALSRRLKDNTDIITAASAYGDGQELCDVYAGGVADIVTMHYDRTNNFGDGVWRPVRQPWGFPLELPCGDLPATAANNEPIGPSSSVASDSDPLRLVMSAVITYIANQPLYVLHTGSGVRGLDDPARNRPANLWEVDNIETTVAGYQAMQTYLPADLPRWSRQNWHWTGHPLTLDPESVVRAYAAVNGADFIVAPIGMVNPVTMSPKQAAHIEALDPLTGAVIQTWDLAAGQSFTLPNAPALVLRGRNQ